MTRTATPLHRHPLPAVLLVVLIAYFPLLIHGMPRGHDMWLHLPWTTYFSGEVLSGIAYPRWLPDMNDGYGSPVFFFYPPIPFFINVPIHGLLPGPTHAPRVLGISTVLSFLVGSVGMYLWLKRLGPRSSAAVGAMFYGVAPYRSFIDVYHRCAFAELWAFAWAPFIFLAVEESRISPSRSMMIGSLFSCLLICSHAPSTLVLIPLVWAHALYRGRADKAWRSTLISWGGILIGIGLSGIYLTTALTMDRYVDRDSMFAQYKYKDHFLFGTVSSFAPRMLLRSFSGRLGAATLGTFLVTAFSLAILILCRDRFRLRHIGALLFLSVSVMFMMLPLSLPVWNFLPVLYKIQFPWRLNIVLALVAALALGMSTTALSHARGALAAAGRVSVVLMVFCIIPSLTLVQGIRRFAYGGRVVSKERIELLLSSRDDAREHLPRNVTPRTAAVLGEERVKVLEGSGHAEIIVWQPRRIVVRADARDPLILAIRQYDFVGWRAYIDGSTQGEDADALRHLGLVGLALRKGNHVVEFRMQATPQERIGAAITLLSLFGLATMTILFRRREAVLAPA